MFRKSFLLMFIICFSISLLAACAKSTEVISLPPPTITQPVHSVPPRPIATVELPPTVTPWPTPTPLPTLAAGQAITFTSLHMVDATTGWAIKDTGHIVRTTGSGENWSNVTPPQGSYTEGGFFALDAAIAWATPRRGGCGPADCPSGEIPPPTSTTVWHTTDAGQTWQASQPLLMNVYLDMGQDSVPYVEPIALQFIDAQTGWLLLRVNHMMMHDHLALFKTEDGGENWKRLVDEQHHPNSSLPCNADSLAFVDAQTGWMGGNCLHLATGERWDTYRTIDGGQTWDRFALPAPPDLPAEFAQYNYECASGTVTRFPAGLLGAQIFCRVYVTDSDYHGFSYYYLSADAGQTWHTWSLANLPEFVNANVGWRLAVSGESQPGELQQTLDGGLTWTAIKSVSWQQAQFDFVNEQVGWVIVTDGDVTALLHTTDGGRTWIDVDPHIP